MTNQPIVVWTEIPVRDIAAAAAFYDSVFGFSTTTDRSEGEIILNDTGDTVGASLVLGSGQSDTVLHMVVPDSLDAAADRAVAAGGQIVGEVTEVPPGSYIIATDPDGNRVGLFKPKAA